MHNNYIKKGFTLVELLVVVIIIAILGTIAFISLDGFTGNSRNGVRVTDLDNIKKGLEVYAMTNGKFPSPSLGLNITYSGGTAWVQGTVGDSVIQKIQGSNISKKPVDPLTGNEYTYSIINTKTEYSLGAILEGGNVVYNTIGGIEKTNADSVKSARALIVGNYNGKILRVSTGGTDYILAVPSIINGDITKTDVVTILQNKTLVYNGYTNLPASYTNKGYTMTGGFNFTLNNPVVFSGNITNLKMAGLLQQQLITNLQTVYSGTQLQNETNIKDIISAVDSNSKQKLVLDFISNDFGGIVNKGKVNISSSISYSSTYYSGGSSGVISNPVWFDYNISNTTSTVGPSVYSVIRDGNNIWVGSNGGVSKYNGSTWKTYSTSDGLASNLITTLFKDSLGNIWAGSPGGVSKYNGTNWITYNTSNGLPTNEIRGISEDNSGNIWLASFGSGAIKYNGTSWITYNTSNGLASNYISGVIKDLGGSMIFGTYGGNQYTKYNSGIFSQITVGTMPSTDYIKAVFQDSLGNLWVSTTFTGLYKYSGGIWTVYTSGNTSGILNVNPSSIFQDSLGNMWFGGNGLNVVKFDGINWIKYSSGLLTNNTSGIAQDSSGNIYVGSKDFIYTPGGLNIYNGISWTNVMYNGLPSMSIRKLFIDNSGNIWIGSDNGVIKFNGSTWTTYLYGNGIEGITQDNFGNIWVSGFAIFQKFDGTSWTSSPSGITGAPYTILYKDKSGNIWAGTWSGVSKYNGTSWVNYSTVNGNSMGRILSIFQDSSGNMWFGTDYMGLHKFDGSTWVTYTTANGLASDSIYEINQDKSGNIWAGTRFAGVSKFDGSTWVTYTTTDGLFYNEVLSIIVDSLGNLLFPGSGITKFNGTTWTYYNYSDFSSRSSVIDNLGNIWIGTSSGLFKYGK